MHADQVDVSAETVIPLVAAQFPQWRAHPVRPIESHGTVNALFRLGDDIVLRFPLQPRLDPAMEESLLREQDNARRIAALTELQVPQPLGIGRPGEGYPGLWTAYRWIPGRTADLAAITDLDGFARDLARFVRDLRAMSTGGRRWDGHSRGGPLSGRSAAVSRALAESTHLIDVPRITEVWQRCLQVPGHRGPDVWIHADLMPGNLLVRGGRLTAVIDLGTACIGDPAVDLMPAWNFLPAAPRKTYREALTVDDATWERGRGWAIAQAVMALPYYVHTNPVMADTARLTLDAVVD
jgi:aminoglycoside phosphotransferase (APT) family kinase protein